jgi:hypothetical protein
MPTNNELLAELAAQPGDSGLTNNQLLEILVEQGGGGGGVQDRIQSADTEAVMFSNGTDFGQSLVVRSIAGDTTYMNIAFPGQFSIYGNTGANGDGDWDKGIDFSSSDLSIYTPDGTIRLSNATAPTSSADPGSEGQVIFASDYIYVYRGGSWKRTALSTF